jgi:predicted kinase
MIGYRFHVLTGAPGSGKTTIAEPLAALLPDFVVLDMDLLLEPASQLAGVDLHQPDAAGWWPTYNDLWLRLAATLARSHPVLLLGPLVPDEVERAPSRRLFAGAEWAVLDCSDEARRERLLRRGYTDAAIEDAIADAATTRALGLHTLSTEEITPDETASQVAKWAMRLHHG